MKKLILIGAITCLIYACSGGAGSNSNATSGSTDNAVSETKPAYDPHRGEGKFDHVDLSPT
ncbi:MAG: cytochrome c, partial [Parafilimonas sp.]